MNYRVFVLSLKVPIITLIRSSLSPGGSDNPKRSVGFASRRDDEQRAAPRGGEQLWIERDVASGDIRERRHRLGGNTRRELRLDGLEPAADRVTRRRSGPRSSRA